MKVKYIKFILGTVLLFSGIFLVQVQAQVAATPGGITRATVVAWLTSDNYNGNTGTWTNLIKGTSGLGDFNITPTNGITATGIPPVLSNSGGFNFFPVVTFDKPSIGAAPNALFSQNPINLQTTDNFTAIFVFQRATLDNYDGLLGMASGDQITSLSYRTTGNNSISFAWGGTARYDVDTIQSGIFILDNSNTNSTSPTTGLGYDGMRYYNNGVLQAQGTRTFSNSWSSPGGVGSTGGAGVVGSVALGNAGLYTGPYYGYQGNLQEVILIRNTGGPNTQASGQHLDPVELQQIQSYLAVKYGITLKSAGDYLNSAGQTVWSRSAAATSGFTYKIFGIARDDASGLYLKQSESVDNTGLSVFVGNSLATINSQNTGTLDNMEYLMMAANSATPIVSLNNFPMTGYRNGDLQSNTGFNLQSCTYQSQLTGPDASLQVTLQSSSNDFTYLLVSSDSTFAPGNTDYYTLNNRDAQVTFTSGVAYFKYVGFSTGPGGVNLGLRLWLRADDDASVTITPLSLTSDTRLSGYPDAVSDPNNVPAVSVWSDLIRNQTYSYDADAATANHRIPVMQYYSPLMNYHPAVRFWGSGTTYGAYLSNTGGIMNLPTDVAAQPASTAIFLVNNNFGTNPWVYNMMFGSATGTANYNGPGYAVQQPTGATYAGGRFRTSATEAMGSKNLFQPGATSILDYIQSYYSTTLGSIVFRFNGQVDSTINGTGNTGVTITGGNQYFSWGSFDMRAPSQLGKGYTFDRVLQGVMSEAIIFDRQLTSLETQQVESYMALKYGITLYPSNTATNRFTYLFSDSSVVWPGDSPDGNIYATYYNNVASVIRDDAARLNNTHSHSTNVGSLLHMGVAGTTLSDDGSNTGSLNDLEAVTFGNDTATTITQVADPASCGAFAYKFDRVWLVHKITQNDRPIDMLVGAQNNMGLTIGNDPNMATYYTDLTSGYNVSLLIADSPDSLKQGLYKAVVPMRYINGEQQCNYTFTDEDTYLSFGFKANRGGCVGDDPVFSGAKVYQWTNWTSQTNRVVSPRSVAINDSIDLGDSIYVLQTKVTYPVNVNATVGYPRSVSSPLAGSLQVIRQGGTVLQDVAITIKFNRTVIPSFTIAGIDGYNNSYEEVEVKGSCSGSDYVPTLSYATSSTNANYKISGNIATCNKNISMDGNNLNGMVNVNFVGGVDSVTILYRTKVNTSTIVRNLYISPITLRSVPPPPPINEDGLSFVKAANNTYYTTCDPATFTFEIQNTNCDDKSGVTFSDTLPANMTWNGSIGLDAVSDSLNQTVTTEVTTVGNREILTVQNLVIPGTGTLLLTAGAQFLDQATSGIYNNSATISYIQVVNNIDNPRTLQSVDKYTLLPQTSFSVTQETELLQESASMVAPPHSYRENSAVTFVVSINNPNQNTPPNMFMDLYFNPDFTYVPNSMKVSMSTGTLDPTYVPVVVDSVGGMLMIGSIIDSVGFVQPTGTMQITFQLRSPSTVVYAVDSLGNPTKQIEDLDLDYIIYSTSDDDCLLKSIEGLNGYVAVPYATAKTSIITNQHVTTKITGLSQ